MSRGYIDTAKEISSSIVYRVVKDIHCNAVKADTAIIFNHFGFSLFTVYYNSEGG